MKKKKSKMTAKQEAEISKEIWADLDRIEKKGVRKERFKVTFRRGNICTLTQLPTREDNNHYDFNGAGNFCIGDEVFVCREYADGSTAICSLDVNHKNKWGKTHSSCHIKTESLRFVRKK